MRTHRLAALIVIVALVALAAAPAYAQEATLKVKVKPKTAYTLVDGQPYGQGKRTIRLVPGEHEVSILRYGYKPHIEKVTITAGATRRLDVTLEPVGGALSGPWGRIRLMVSPTQTGVYLNGKTPEHLIGCTGATDWNFIAKQELLVRPGTHTVTLALEGYRTYSTTVTLAANQRIEIRHTMQAGSGEESVPASAQTAKDEKRLANLNNIPREKTGFASMHAALAPVSLAFAANPTGLQCGGSSRLTWSASEAPRVEISGLGAVLAAGDRLVEPRQTTTYTLTAAGPGGVETASATVAVDAAISAAFRASADTIRYRKVGEKVVEHTSSTLTWSTANAQSVAIDPFGTVSASGSRSLQPAPRQTAVGAVDETLTYTLAATNSCGGRETRTATLRLTGSIEPAPEVLLHSVFFPTDYPDERHPGLGLLRSQRRGLQLLADGFKKYIEVDPGAQLLLEAHADERRSRDYNRALSERRAALVKQFLVDAGIPASRLDYQGFGEDQNLERAAVASLEEQNPDKAPRVRLQSRHANWLAHNRRVDVVLRPSGERSLRYYPHLADDSRILWQVPKPSRQTVEKNQ